jgi:hypothetical protein
MEDWELARRLSESIRVTRMDDGLRVTSHCLYPSNNAVVVSLRGGNDEFVLSDDGGAVLELSDTGFVDQLTDRQMASFVVPQGLKVKNGVIYTPTVPLQAVPAAVILLANVSKEVADWGSQHLKFRFKRNFKADLAALLDHYFHDNLKHDAAIIGASNKPHKFGHVVFLSGDRKLLVDPVISDGSSINARVVANMDVRLAKDPTIRQLIVYDDSLDWQSADLRLLELGAPTVGFSHAEQTIRRLAA